MSQYLFSENREGPPGSPVRSGVSIDEHDWWRRDESERVKLENAQLKSRIGVVDRENQTLRWITNDVSSSSLIWLSYILDVRCRVWRFVFHSLFHYFDFYVRNELRHASACIEDLVHHLKSLGQLPSSDGRPHDLSSLIVKTESDLNYWYRMGGIDRLVGERLLDRIDHPGRSDRLRFDDVQLRLQPQQQKMYQQKRFDGQQRYDDRCDGFGNIRPRNNVWPGPLFFCVTKKLLNLVKRNWNGIWFQVPFAYCLYCSIGIKRKTNSRIKHIDYELCWDRTVIYSDLENSRLRFYFDLHLAR